jgi:hypothetical protein
MRRLVGLRDDDEDDEATLEAALGSSFFAAVELTFFSTAGAAFLATAPAPLATSEPIPRASISSKSRAARADSNDSTGRAKTLLLL